MCQMNSHPVFQFLIICVVCVSINGKLYEFGKMVDVGSAAFSEIIDIIADVSLHNCIEMCKYRPACRHINYKFPAKVCYIIKHEGSNQTILLMTGPGYATGSKTDWSMTEYVSCAACSNKDECTQDGGITDCITSHCGIPTIPATAAGRGNMFTTGSRHIYECTDGTSQQHGHIGRITCSAMGNWTESNVTCLSETAMTTSSTALATTTIAMIFYCHVLDTSFRNIQLYDGSFLTYRLTQAPKTSKESADFKCSQADAALMKVTTLARMAFLQRLTSCSNVAPVDIWIDGSYDTSTLDWRTYDGYPVPMTTQFWAAGSPTAATSGTCIYLSSATGYKFKNQDCGLGSAFMCEIPQP